MQAQLQLVRRLSFLKKRKLQDTAPTAFPQEGYELARVKSFNRVRGFGYLVGPIQWSNDLHQQTRI